MKIAKGFWRFNSELYKIYSELDVVKYIKVHKTKWADHLTRMHEDRSCKNFFLAKSIGERLKGRFQFRWVVCVVKDLDILKVKNHQTVTKSSNAWSIPLEMDSTYLGLSSRWKRWRLHCLQKMIQQFSSAQKIRFLAKPVQVH